MLRHPFFRPFHDARAKSEQASLVFAVRQIVGLREKGVHAIFAQSNRSKGVKARRAAEEKKRLRKGRGKSLVLPHFAMRKSRDFDEPKRERPSKNEDFTASLRAASGCLRLPLLSIAHGRGAFFNRSKSSFFQGAKGLCGRGSSSGGEPAADESIAADSAAGALVGGSKAMDSPCSCAASSALGSSSKRYPDDSAEGEGGFKAKG